MLTVQHLSRLGPQGAIVGKGAGPPPLVTGRRVKPIIGEAWEIQYRVGRGEGVGGTPSSWKSKFSLPKSKSRLLRIAWCQFPPLSGNIHYVALPPSPAAPAIWPHPTGMCVTLFIH